MRCLPPTAGQRARIPLFVSRPRGPVFPPDPDHHHTHDAFIMCWTPAASAAFGALSAAAATAYARNGNARKAAFFAYFAAMELLQLAQHAAHLGVCASPLNQALTVAAWLHVAFQPFVLNGTLLEEDDVGRGARGAVVRLSAAAGVLLALRLPFRLNPFTLLGGLLPDLPPPSSAGDCGRYDPLCGGALCTYRGAKHIAWSLPLLPPSYYLPGGFIHFFLFFGPALLLAGPRAPVRRAVVCVALLIGPVTAMALVRSAESYQHEWAAVWCLVSAAMTFLIPLGDAVADRMEAAKAAGRATRPAVAGALDSTSVVRRPVTRGSPAASPTLRRPLVGTPGRGV